VANGGFHLVTETAAGVLVEEVLAPGGAGPTWQWLDASDGQPADEVHVGIRDDTEGLRERRGELRGGRLLLLGRKVVLDVATLDRHAFEWSDSAPGLDGFNASTSVAQALSPRGDQLLLLGSRRRGDGFEHALVAVDYRANRCYFVPVGELPPGIANGLALLPRAWLEEVVAWEIDGDGTTRLRAVEPSSGG
jgi:hypothetical protein